MYLTRNEKEKCIMARMYRGGKLFQSNFTLKQYGTWEEAESAAQSWVEQTLPTIPEAVPIKGRKTRRNSSGIVGVQFAKKHPHKSGARNGADRWLAFWPGCPNAGGISWSVEKYGDEQVFWLSVNRTFGLLVINHHERRRVHAKKASQLHPGRESIHFTASSSRSCSGI